MTHKEIFDLAERHGWLDDFGRWNFKDDGLLDFVSAIVVNTAPVHASDIPQEPVDETAKCGHEWVWLTDEEKRQILLDDPIDWINAIEAKLKEKNT